jgi:hypothetical protein
MPKLEAETLRHPLTRIALVTKFFTYTTLIVFGSFFFILAIPIAMILTLGWLGIIIAFLIGGS